MKTRIFAILFGLFLFTACGQLEGNTLTFRTADPALSIGLALLPAPPIPTIEPAVAPCAIKVNQSADGTYIYHLPGQVSYTRTIIEPSKNEFFACTEDEAVAAGARKALR